MIQYAWRVNGSFNYTFPIAFKHQLAPVGACSSGVCNVTDIKLTGCLITSYQPSGTPRIGLIVMGY